MLADCLCTSLLSRSEQLFYSNNPILKYISPGIRSNRYVADHKVNGCHIELAPWDTAYGTQDFDRLRPLSYRETHVVLLCFRVDSRESFDRVEEHVRL